MVSAFTSFGATSASFAVASCRGGDRRSGINAFISGSNMFAWLAWFEVSRHATGVTLLLFDAETFVKPLAAFTLDPLHNKTGRIWHCFVPRVAGARYYAYRVEGPTGALHQFDAQKVLLDPFAGQVFFPPDFSRAAAMNLGANDGRAPLGVLPMKRPITGECARLRHPPRFDNAGCRWAALRGRATVRRRARARMMSASNSSG